MGYDEDLLNEIEAMHQALLLHPLYQGVPCGKKRLVCEVAGDLCTVIQVLCPAGFTWLVEPLNVDDGYHSYRDREPIPMVVKLVHETDINAGYQVEMNWLPVLYRLDRTLFDLALDALHVIFTAGNYRINGFDGDVWCFDRDYQTCLDEADSDSKSYYRRLLYELDRNKKGDIARWNKLIAGRKTSEFKARLGLNTYRPEADPRLAEVLNEIRDWLLEGLTIIDDDIRTYSDTVNDDFNEIDSIVACQYCLFVWDDNWALMGEFNDWLNQNVQAGGNEPPWKRVVIVQREEDWKVQTSDWPHRFEAFMYHGQQMVVGINRYIAIMNEFDLWNHGKQPDQPLLSNPGDDCLHAGDG